MVHISRRDREYIAGTVMGFDEIDGSRDCRAHNLFWDEDSRLALYLVLSS